MFFHLAPTPLFQVHFFHYAFGLAPPPFQVWFPLCNVYGWGDPDPHLPFQILVDVGLFIGRLLQLSGLVQYALMLSFEPYILLKPMFELVLIPCNLHVFNL